MKFDLNQNIVHSNTTMPKSVLGIPKKNNLYLVAQQTVTDD
jgi:hypothetical protein